MSRILAVEEDDEAALQAAAERAMGGDPADARERLRTSLASGDARVFVEAAAALADLAPDDARGVARALGRLHKEAIDRLRDVEARLRARNRLLARAAHRDPLTGIANRATLDESLATELRRAQRYAHDFSVLFVDVDHFKRVNDTRGHAAGDRLLKELAATISASLRPGDAFGRYGGEEFVIGLVNADARAALRTGERIRRDVEGAAFEDGATRIKVTVSIGAATMNRGEDSPVSLLVERADRAMFAAKANGRNCVCSSEPRQVTREHRSHC